MLTCVCCLHYQAFSLLLYISMLTDDEILRVVVAVVEVTALILYPQTQ